jgi:AcrR family transcriptional regulator
MTSLRNSAQEAHLDAAREVIIDLGWRRTTLTEVARRAGVSRMTIYRHWEDRERLLADLMTREWADTLTKTLAGIADDDSLDSLVELMLETVAALRRSPLLQRIIDLDPEMLLPYILQRTGRSQKALLTMLAARIERAQDAGQVRKGDPEVLARTMLLVLEGLLLSVDTMKTRSVSRAKLTAEYKEILTRGLAR